MADRYQVTFRRTFYVVTTVVAVLAFAMGIIATGQEVGGAVAVMAFMLGTSNGMVWSAERVRSDDGEPS